MIKGAYPHYGLGHKGQYRNLQSDAGTPARIYKKRKSRQLVALSLDSRGRGRAGRRVRRVDHQGHRFSDAPRRAGRLCRTSDLPTDTVTALQDALTPFCSDLNGDGKVVVQVDSYTVDFDAANESTDAYYQMAGVTRLSAELSSGGKTYIFLLEDPEGFETQTGALQYLDGTVPDDPETTDADWREMVYRWTDCPVLTGLDLAAMRVSP